MKECEKYYLGVDIGGTSVKAGIVTENGEIIYKDSMPTVKEEGGEGLVRGVALLVEKVLADAGVRREQIIALGVGCPGDIDAENGVIIWAGNLKLENFPLKDTLTKYFTMPIFVNNDANCAALGEFYALQDDSISSFIVVTLGTGVGGGIILNRKIYTGYNGTAGEFGHMTLCMDGLECACGRKGCFEVYASTSALVRYAEDEAKENVDSVLEELITQNGGRANGKIVFEALKRKDSTAEKVFAKYCRYLSEGLIGIINIFQPQMLVIGGGLSSQGDVLLTPVCQYIEQSLHVQPDAKHTEIRTALLGNDAGIIGAAFLVKQYT